MKPIDPRHSDPRALGDRRAGGGIPQLAVHEDLAVRTERGPGHADLADHPFLPGRHPRAPRAQHYSSEKYSDDADGNAHREDRKSTRLNSSHTVISYAVFCLKKKNTKAERLYA